jgi:cytochrome c
MRLSLPFFVVGFGALLLSGCASSTDKKSSTPAVKLDGEALAKSKCSECHNLEMPPKTSEGEKAPPLYTITVHLKDWIKADTPTEGRAKFIAFAKKYTLHPSHDISYCDKKSLQTYGLMPSLEGKATEAEIAAVAAWAYDTYDQMQMMAIMKERNRLAALPPHEQVLETHDCKLCHLHGNGKLAPTFKQIGSRYGEGGLKKIQQSITQGSHGKWPSFHTPMRPYTDLTLKQLDGIARWIATQK